MVSTHFRYPQAFGSLNRVETLDSASNYYNMCTLITIASLFSLMQYGLAPLIVASHKGQKDVVELLLDKGANVDQQNKV